MDTLAPNQMSVKPLYESEPKRLGFFAYEGQLRGLDAYEHPPQPMWTDDAEEPDLEPFDA